VIGLLIKFYGNAFIYNFSLFCLTYILPIHFGGVMVVLCEMCVSSGLWFRHSRMKLSVLNALEEGERRELNLAYI